ncbi:MAG: ATP-binding cassette domain-containing protein [Oscillospiraceae bacterium]
MYLENQSVFDLKDKQLAILRRRRIGFVFQAYNLLGEHTARENLCIPLNLDGRDPDPAFFQEVTGALGIEKLLDKYPDELSGGEQQRVAIGRALMIQPGDSPGGRAHRQPGPRHRGGGAGAPQVPGSPVWPNGDPGDP